MKNNYTLAADIGGTNSRLALFLAEDAKKSIFLIQGETREKSNIFNSFNDLLSEIIAVDNRYDVNKCSNFIIAVPGAITSDNLIHLPYVSWKKIDQAALKKQYPHAVLINDFVAQAYGCLTEATKNAVLITGKERQEQGDIAVIGAGTGTGHCALKKIDLESYACIPSEAGHIPFPFLFDDEIESGFRAFLIATKDDDDNKRNNLIPVCNDVVSGPGLSRLHRYLTKKRLAPSEVIEEIKSQPDSQTTKYFARFYGRVCRNYALSTLASGGTLYISGGVAIKNRFLVDNDFFKEEFLNSETTARKLLEQIPVYLIQDERIGLFGAAYYGAKIAQAT